MPFSPSFAPSVAEISLDIPIVHDQIPEEIECFTCTIVTKSVPEKLLLCASPITTICIVDAGELSSAYCFIMYMHSSCVYICFQHFSSAHIYNTVEIHTHINTPLTPKKS